MARPEAKNNRKRITHPTNLKGAKLRLQRKGTMIHYSFAPLDSSEFTEIMATEFGAENIRVRLVANTGNSTVPLEVRFLDFQIEGTEIADLPMPKKPEDEHTSPQWIWAVAAVIGVLLLLGGIGLYWRSKRVEADENEEEE